MSSEKYIGLDVAANRRFRSRTFAEPEGVFAAAYALLDSGDLPRDEWKVLREMLNWFNANLKSPPKTFDARRAIF